VGKGAGMTEELQFYEKELKYYEGRIEVLAAENRALRLEKENQTASAETIRRLRSRVADLELGYRQKQFCVENLERELERVNAYLLEAKKSIRSINGKLLVQSNRTKQAEKSLAAAQLCLEDIRGKAGKYLRLRSMLLSLIGR
jgi:hypothetical protein